MFENHTVIVVGAGASSECRLPTGTELKRQIATLLDIRFPNGFEQTSGDTAICEAFRIQTTRSGPREDVNSYLHVSWRIRDAMPQAISIDNFVDAHQGNTKLELCGKLAIARAILSGEQRSLLYVNPRGDTQHHATK